MLLNSFIKSLDAKFSKDQTIWNTHHENFGAYPMLIASISLSEQMEYKVPVLTQHVTSREKSWTRVIHNDALNIFFVH